MVQGLVALHAFELLQLNKTSQHTYKQSLNSHVSLATDASILMNVRSHTIHQQRSSEYKVGISVNIQKV